MSDDDALDLVERFLEIAGTLRDLGDTTEDWSGFPVVVRIVDRGDPTARTADIGAMELYAASVVSSDPFAVVRALAGRLR